MHWPGTNEAVIDTWQEWKIYTKIIKLKHL